MEIIQVTKEELKNAIREVLCEILQTQKGILQDELLSRKAAAKYLGVTFPTLNKWEKTGRIKATRFGGNRVYFKKSELFK